MKTQFPLEQMEGVEEIYKRLIKPQVNHLW